jgi:hypothetical protein
LLNFLQEPKRGRVSLIDWDRAIFSASVDDRAIFSASVDDRATSVCIFDVHSMGQPA